MSPEEVVEVDCEVWRLLARAARSRFLATAFAYPEPSVLAELAAAPWPDAGEEPEGLRRAFGAFRVACAAAEPASLQDQHLSLFDRQVLCSPYETSYGDGRRLGGKPVELADISGFYGAFGLEPSRSHRQMPDHIAVELEFMSVLCLKEAYALFHGLAEERDVTREAQGKFLADHLGRWAGGLTEALEAAAEGAFFKALADLLREFVSEECRLLGVTPRRADEARPEEPLDQLTCPFAPTCEGAPAEWREP